MSPLRTLIPPHFGHDAENAQGYAILSIIRTKSARLSRFSFHSGIIFLTEKKQLQFSWELEGLFRKMMQLCRPTSLRTCRTRARSGYGINDVDVSFRDFSRSRQMRKVVFSSDLIIGLPEMFFMLPPSETMLMNPYRVYEDSEVRRKEE
jgi:hypothetical protein